MITHKQGSLFEIASPGSVIVHAVNAQGVWGSGIAKAFKELYPESYKCYHSWCEEDVLGYAALSNYPKDEKHWVSWICTSGSYGNRKDSVELIKINTTLALLDLCKKLYASHPRDTWEDIPVYSNKFNSGLFGVPWKDSEMILETILNRFPRINWTVCDNNVRILDDNF